MHRTVTVIVAAVGLAIIAPAAARAASCNAPITVFSGNLTLTADYVKSSGTTPCFILQNGYDLLLNGHSITCTQAACGTAVQIATSSAASVVKNLGTISGPFAIGVDASAVSSGANTIVQNVTISGVTGTGIKKARTVSKVEITGPSIGIDGAVTVEDSKITGGAGQYGILGTVETVQANTVIGAEYAIAGGRKIQQNVIQVSGKCAAIMWFPTIASDYVRSNYIECAGDIGGGNPSLGVLVSSGYAGTGTGPKGEANLIYLNGTGFTGLSGKWRLLKNKIFLGAGSTAVDPGSTTPTIDGNNMCDDAAICPDPPVAPFTLG